MPRRGCNLPQFDDGPKRTRRPASAAYRVERRARHSDPRRTNRFLLPCAQVNEGPMRLGLSA